MPQLKRTDKSLFCAVVLTVFFGLVMVYSASSVMAQVRYESPWHFVVPQTVAVVISLGVMMLLKRMHYRRLQSPAVAFAAIGVVVILLAVVYLVDTRHHRFFRFGLVSLQPAELAKPAVVVFLAYFVAWRARAINNRHTLWPALMAVGLVTIGVVIADLGTAVVLGIAAAAVFFAAGLERRYFYVLAAIAVFGGVYAVASKPYRLARIVQFYDPQYRWIDHLDTKGRLKAYLRRSMAARDTNYQADQSKIAVGAGGLMGLGLMQGKQKLFYLPEPHTDFIYAVVGEELGLVGAAGILAVFGLVLWRGLRAAVQAQDDFGRYLALGVTTMIVVQAFMNMSVALALAPTKGIPLPMISSGANSLFSTLVMLGMLMNVSENGGWLPGAEARA